MTNIPPNHDTGVVPGVHLKVVLPRRSRHDGDGGMNRDALQKPLIVPNVTDLRERTECLQLLRWGHRGGVGCRLSIHPPSSISLFDPDLDYYRSFNRHKYVGQGKCVYDV